MRLNSGTGTEGLPMFSLNCNRPLGLHFYRPQVAMHCKCHLFQFELKTRLSFSTVFIIAEKNRKRWWFATAQQYSEACERRIGGKPAYEY